MVFTACLLAPVRAWSQIEILDQEAELFVDDVNIRFASGVNQTLHQAEKLTNPVIRPEKPWESNGTYLYGTVLRDEQTGKFRMWYSSGGLAYAESDDGINWTRPELNDVLRNGQPTNLLLTGSNLNFLIYDPDDPDPAYRYKLLDNTSTRNFVGYHSADGLAWNPYPQTPLIEGGSEIANGFRDPVTGRYVAFVRPYAPQPYPSGPEQTRMVAMTTSDDFVNWTDLEVILEPDSIDNAWANNESERTEFYSMAGFRYGNQYLGLLPVFRITDIYDDPEPRQSRYEGPIDVQLVSTRDGSNWQRTEPRTPVITTGPSAFDNGAILNIANQPVIVGDEIFYYYTAMNTTHGGTRPPKGITIGLAKWRLDGFASLDAGDLGGFVETTEWVTQGDLTQLVINADATDGSIRVEVVDENGVIYDGYSVLDSDVVTGDSVRHVVSWTEHAGLPDGEVFRLRFYMENASIYSYRVQVVPEPAGLALLGLGGGLALLRRPSSSPIEN